MAKANMSCMYINVWVHHMQVDELFDFLNGRVTAAPPYWLNEHDTPFSISGGYVMVTMGYDMYSELRANRA
jgi:hypothetical protein